MPRVIYPRPSIVLRPRTIRGLTHNSLELNTALSVNENFKKQVSDMIAWSHNHVRGNTFQAEEWESLLDFDGPPEDTDPGHIHARKQFTLLSHMLGISTLVEAVLHPRPPRCTEGTVPGPYPNAPSKPARNGAAIYGRPEDKDLFFVGSIRDTNGRPIKDVKVTAWHADGNGLYDSQVPDWLGIENKFLGPCNRATFKSTKHGEIWFHTTKPAPFMPKCFGTAASLLESSKRRNGRPECIHFKFEKEGYDNFQTTLFIRGSDFLIDDFAIGVKESLIVELKTVTLRTAMRYGGFVGRDLMQFKFVLATTQEMDALRPAHMTTEENKEDKNAHAQKDDADDDDEDERPAKKPRTERAATRLPTLDLMLN